MVCPAKANVFKAVPSSNLNRSTLALVFLHKSWQVTGFARIVRQTRGQTPKRRSASMIKINAPQHNTFRLTGSAPNARKISELTKIYWVALMTLILAPQPKFSHQMDSARIALNFSGVTIKKLPVKMILNLVRSPILTDDGFCTDCDAYFRANED